MDSLKRFCSAFVAGYSQKQGTIGSNAKCSRRSDELELVSPPPAKLADS